MTGLTQSNATSGGLSRVKVLIIPLALTVTLLGGIGWYLRDSSQAAKKARIQDNRIVELRGDLTYLDEVLTMSARMATATGDNRWEERYLSFEPKVDAAFNEAKQLLPTVFSGEAMSQLDASIPKLIEMEHRAFKLIRQGQRPAAAALLSSPEYEQQKQIYTQALEQITNGMKKYVESSLQAQDRQTSVAVTIVFLALVILLIAWSSVLRTLIRYISTIKNVESAISTTTVEISSTIEEQERLATHQASAVNQTTTTMDELGASSRISAEQAEAASQGAREVLTLVNGSYHTDRSAFMEGASLLQRVRQITEQIVQLSEQTNQIGTISTLVSDLANQTNMLALNAAVEAVRAGENGKGFSVVASEIRKLADQSKKAAERIHGLVVDINNSTSSTVMVTDEGRKTVETVAEAINKIAVNSQQISLTSKQQSVAIQQVVEAMNNINQGALQTATGISQTKSGTQKLKEAANELKSVV